MNTLDIIPSVVEKLNQTYIIDFSISIDKEEPLAFYDVDLYSIMEFLNPTFQWDYTLWTCGCGVPDCAGLVSFPVKHFHNKLELTFYSPITYNKTWDQDHTSSLLTFSKKQIFDMLWNLASKIEDIINNNKDTLINYNIGTETHSGVVYDLPTDIRVRLTEYKYLYLGELI